MEAKDRRRQIRFARRDDAEAIRAIYAAYIATGITFEYHLPSVGDFQKKILEIGRDYPFLVIEEEGRVIGYAYGHRYREREAYQWTAELSTYLSPSAQGKGLIRPLYAKLNGLMRLQNIKTLYALITSANPRSIAVHERLGFTPMGVHHKAGYKGGQWLDMHWYQLRLGDVEDDPKPFIPLHRVGIQNIRWVMKSLTGGV